jgi:MoaA/NifB/PqqE/SkfB family radical SAM enzyme
MKSYLRDVAQLSKQAIFHLGIVPPPFRIQIDITDKCNFRCPTCSKWKADDLTGELESQHWKTVFEKIRDVPLLHEITIGGGEPFARQDTFEILKFSKQQGFFVVVTTNGWFLNRGMLERLDELGVNRLMVSLNSLNESTHDKSRATPGSYNRIMRLLECWSIKPRTTNLCLATVVMEANCCELGAIARFAHDRGLSGTIFQALAHEKAHFPFSKESHMPESAMTWYDQHPLWVQSFDILRSEIEKLIQMQKEGYPIINPGWQLRKFPLYYEKPEFVRTLPCLGTLSTMYIDPNGDVRLCYGYPPIGTILCDNPRHLWKNDRARKIRKESRKCERLCRLLNNNL